MINYVQGQTYFLDGSGITSGATTIKLTAMMYPGDTTDVVTADLGSICYAVLEPETSREENISFTTITQNGDGTATLSGVVRGLMFKSPYTQDLSLAQVHTGGSKLRISNTAPFYNAFASTQDDQTIAGIYTFTDPNVPRMDVTHTYGAGDGLFFATKAYVDGVALAGAPNADTSTKGVVQIATGAQLAAGTGTGSTGAVIVPAGSSFKNRSAIII